MKKTLSTARKQAILRRKSLLEKAKQKAEHNLVNCIKSEEMFKKIKETYDCSISEKYQAAYYLAATGNYSAEDLALMLGHKSENLNADFNKNLGVHLKSYFELDDDERVGITSLRRLLFQKGFLFDINDIDLVDILEQRLDENAQAEQLSQEGTSLSE